MHQTSSGSYILIIKDDPYEAVYPVEKRLINQTIDANLEVKERWYTINGKNIPEINILWNVKDITPETAASLDTKEQILLLKDYLFGQKIIISMKNNQDLSIVQAMDDYNAAVSLIFTDIPDYESSCGASVRFACQIFSAKLRAEGKVIDENQSLESLAAKLDEADFKEIEGIIPWLQKNADEGVSSAATQEDAVNAVRSSIALYSILFDK